MEWLDHSHVATLGELKVLGLDLRTFFIAVGAFGGVAAVTVTLLVGLFKFGQWKGEVDQDRKNTEGLSRWQGEVDQDRDNFKSLIGEIKTRLDAIIFHLIGHSPDKPGVAYSRHSPFSLTDLGKKIALEINAESFTSKQVPELIGKVKDKEDFEVHQFCEHFVENNLPQYWDKAVKRTAYSFGLPEYDVRMVLVIVLRDAVIAQKKKGELQET